MPPRIVHVFSTFAAGGPQVRTTDLLTAMGDEVRHVVIAMDRCFDARERLDPALPVEFVNPPPLPGGLASIRSLRTFLRDLAPDLLLTYNWGAIESVAAARGLRAGVIHAEDGFGPEEAERLLARRNWFRRWVLRRASAVVVPSRLLERIARRTWWLGSSVWRIPNGIDVERFAPGVPEAARRDCGRPTAGPVIGTVAKLRAEKDLGVLLEAFVTVRQTEPEARLWIGGDGPERALLEERARALGLGEAVWFAGTLPDPATFYRALDVFALSSRTEQMPLSVTEAMATGLPIVSTRVGDVADMLVPAQAEYLVESGDASALGEALVRMLRHGARQELGAANRAKCVQEYSFEAMLASYRELYRFGLGRSPSPD